VHGEEFVVLWLGVFADSALGDDVVVFRHVLRFAPVELTLLHGATQVSSPQVVHG